MIENYNSNGIASQQFLTNAGLIGDSNLQRKSAFLFESKF